MFTGKLQIIFFILLMGTFYSCNQQEFYEKEALKDGFLERENPIPSQTGDIDEPRIILDDETKVDEDNTNSDTDPEIIIPPSTTEEDSDTSTETDSTEETPSSTVEEDSDVNTETDPKEEPSPSTEEESSNTETDDQVTPTEEEQTPIVETQIHTDTFSQVKGNKKVDILWVIDNSGSMKDEQDALAYNFNVFINDFITQDIDFKMAITTTDARSSVDGKWHCMDKQLNRDAVLTNEDQFIEDFQDCIRVGTSGSGTEKGIHTSNSFLTNHNFLRDDAYLVIVYVSDEEDQSSGSINDRLTQLRSYKTEEGMVKAYSIITKEKVGWQESIGYRYAYLSKETGGLITDIKDNFYDSLNTLGTNIVSLLDEFPLSRRPASQDFAVKVDGVLISKEHYAYNDKNLTIEFLPGYIPEEGQLISISYEID